MKHVMNGSYVIFSLMLLKVISAQMLSDAEERVCLQSFDTIVSLVSGGASDR